MTVGLPREEDWDRGSVRSVVENGTEQKGRNRGPLVSVLVRVFGRVLPDVDVWGFFGTSTRVCHGWSETSTSLSVDPVSR